MNNETHYFELLPVEIDEETLNIWKSLKHVKSGLDYLNLLATNKHKYMEVFNFILRNPGVPFLGIKYSVENISNKNLATCLKEFIESKIIVKFNKGYNVSPMFKNYTQDKEKIIHINVYSNAVDIE